jgi:hypothetical protein
MPEGRRPLGRPRHGWKNNIRINFREIGWGGVDWNMARGRDHWQALLNVIMSLQVP